MPEQVGFFPAETLLRSSALMMNQSWISATVCIWVPGPALDPAVVTPEPTTESGGSRVELICEQYGFGGFG